MMNDDEEVRRGVSFTFEVHLDLYVSFSVVFSSSLSSLRQ